MHCYIPLFDRNTWFERRNKLSVLMACDKKLKAEFDSLCLRRHSVDNKYFSDRDEISLIVHPFIEF